MNRDVAIVAHRGASQDAPENTVASVRLGWAQQADAVEIDVHLTRDGEVVVIHDPTLLRTTGRDARVDESSLAEIRRLDAGIWKGAAWRDERVPTLAEVLATVPAGKRFFVELKETPGLVPALAGVVARGPVPTGDIVLISFDAQALHDAKRALPGCPALLLLDTPDGAPERLPEWIARCHASGFGGLDVSAAWPVTARLVERLRAENLELHVWTVNDARRARDLAVAGVASITTDRPGWLREQLAGD
ncbi:MAG: glycerophosphodiester phosphodiesterase [Opitutaceae bacterium]|jgi:glycerophosphoryl diester phosphodiesterase